MYYQAHLLKFLNIHIEVVLSNLGDRILKLNNCKVLEYLVSYRLSNLAINKFPSNLGDIFLKFYI